ncbi:MAG: helix-turn-helix domain-containing protein [Clostridiales bacterium]|nr:helix-turn-helix domain-containing protein [Clostridiales bacterium]
MAIHLSYDYRLDIEKHLKENYSISEISRRLNRHKNGISPNTCVKRSQHHTQEGWKGNPFLDRFISNKDLPFKHHLCYHS